MTAALQVRDAAVRLGKREVIHEANLEVRGGELVGIIGPNGSGKTTLLRAALGLTPLARGEAFLGGRTVGRLAASERARLASYLPQDRTVGWNIPAELVAALGAPHLPGPPGRERAKLALREVGAGDLSGRRILNMSGGERARVLLARLICGGAPLLVADEPVASLDPAAQMEVLSILRARSRKGAGVLVTLHDLTLALRFCDRVAVMVDGRLAGAGDPGEVLTASTLSQVFGVRGGAVASPFGPVVAVELDGRKPDEPSVSTG